MIGPGSDKHDILVILLSLPSNIVFFFKTNLSSWEGVTHPGKAGVVVVVVVVRRPSPSPLKKINRVISLSGVLLLRGEMVENNRDRTGCTNMPPDYYQLHLFGNRTTPHRLMLDGSSIIEDQTKLRHHIRSVIFTGKVCRISMKKRFLLLTENL